MNFKSAFLVILLAIGSFVSGYKSKDLILRYRIHIVSFLKNDTPSIQDYTQVNCPNNPISIATFGQSNSANSVTPPIQITIPKSLYQYDWKSRKCFKYKEPLLGTNNPYGNVITYTALRISCLTDKPIIIVPFGVGGTSVLEWAFGDLRFQHDIVLKRMKEDGIYPNIFLWHQGETDSKYDDYSEEYLNTPYFERNFTHGKLGISQRGYYESLLAISTKTMEHFPNSHFGIALTSINGGRSIYYPIRNAQKELTENIPNTFISADSDKIYGDGTRSDGVHFSAKGAKILGDEYFKSIKDLLNLNYTE